ncbi:galacturonosyltransferase 5 [Striga asiatica]|uniref:Galacturonosyltransferase 5 n=1 Tax=Striga asiatica TaxID=4170 RepID=A0A5A7QRB0_STRAF|nr:galacturonosyltransferase 5 [Striga asiatica]
MKSAAALSISTYGYIPSDKKEHCTRGTPLAALEEKERVPTNLLPYFEISYRKRIKRMLCPKSPIFLPRLSSWKNQPLPKSLPSLGEQLTQPLRADSIAIAADSVTAADSSRTSARGYLSSLWSPCLSRILTRGIFDCGSFLRAY